MSDDQLRDLQRAWESGDVGVLPHLNAARRRSGLPPLRDKITHYIALRDQHWLNPDGSFRKPINAYGYVARIVAACAVELYPRGAITQRKVVYHTTDKRLVTCKTCWKAIHGAKFDEGGPVVHFRQKGERGPICCLGAGEFTNSKAQITCAMCVAIVTRRAPRPKPKTLNARARRRLRRRAPQSDPLRHGFV